MSDKFSGVGLHLSHQIRMFLAPSFRNRYYQPWVAVFRVANFSFSVIIAMPMITANEEEGVFELKVQKKLVFISPKLNQLC